MSSMAQVQATRVLPNYVGGEWIVPEVDLLDVTNPAGGETLARVPLSTPAEVEAAAAAARRALHDWRDRPVIDRTRFVLALRNELDERQEDVALRLTADVGKSLGEARAEVKRALEMVDAALVAPYAMQGRSLENVSRNVDCTTIRQAVGVCAAITPFNFPVMVALWFLPAAIVCGNTFILKPSEQTPLAIELLVEIVESLGLPTGVVNMVHGSSAAVNALLDSENVDAVSFVGSAQVARHVYARAAATGKRVQAFGGAKNHIVVMPDADMKKAAENIAASAFGVGGQRCMAGSVIVAVDGSWARLRPALVERARAVKMGNGRDDGVEIGPLVSAAARDRVAMMIEQGESEGGRVCVDGRARVTEDGAFIGPTIVEDVHPEMRIAQDELFGPVLAVTEVDDLAAALDVVNASRYGNGTSIFTESGGAARRFAHFVEVGNVGINVGVAAPSGYFSFTGWKGSFFGDVHSQGEDAMRFFTRQKTVTSRFFSDSSTELYFE